MRPLVWSLVMKIFPRIMAKRECEREFEAALLSAHVLPTETLKQIEVIARTCCSMTMPLTWFLLL